MLWCYESHRDFYRSRRTDDRSLIITPWETLRADHAQHPAEYTTLLEMVPSWGQELLVRLHAHHPDSFAHSLRVAATVDAVLEERPIGDIPPEAVTLAALLHDVGKDVVPLSLLDKNGPLTVEERDAMKPHALQSYIAIAPYDLLVAQLAGGHHLYQQDAYSHEDARNAPWDAAIGQQVIAAADSIDAKASVRSYKLAWPHDKVRTSMLEEGNHSPSLIHRVVDARFGMPPFYSISRDTTMFSSKKTVFTA